MLRRSPEDVREGLAKPSARYHMPAPGDMVGTYVIERPLGEGGEASVYKARDVRSGIPVVVKYIETALHDEAAAIERFRREVVIGRLLRHPGIPRMLDVQEHAEPPYLVMDYTEGRSLREIIQTVQKLPLEQAVSIATNLAEVVAYCHSHHVYHRDLKPENILIGEDGRVTIIDFGIALVDNAPRFTWRGLSGLIGTPEYMAPEQIRGDRGGPETDVYAIGVILYEMLTGRPPFRGADMLATVYQHLNMTAEPLRRVRPDVSENLAATVARAMRRRSEERFPNAGEMYTTLRQPRRVEMGILYRPDPPLSMTRRADLFRHPAVLFGGVAVFVAVLALIAGILLRH
jgi:eukaryotic-like serine/threonine-protein kinase